MRGQIQVISAVAALAIAILVLTALFVGVLAGTSAYRVREAGAGVYSILKSKVVWGACELASAVWNATGAGYVNVSVTVYDVLSGAAVGSDSCTLESKAVGWATLRTYTYARESRDGLLYYYVVVVGTK